MGNENSKTSRKGARPPVRQQPLKIPAHPRAPPPPYAAAAEDKKDATAARPMARQASAGIVSEDELEELRHYDTWLLVDDSSSMTECSQGNKTRWDEAGEALAALADKAANYDADGIDVFFLNNKEAVGRGLRNSAGVNALFKTVRPLRTTPIGARLEDLLRKYLAALERAEDELPKPLNIIIITDGIPSDSPEDVIVAIARRLDRGNFPLTQVGLQFVQVGNDQNATHYLTNLDNEINRVKRGYSEPVRDIVDTTLYNPAVGLTGNTLIKALLGGINRRLDRQPSGRAR